ncbi:hypothetical protein [Nostoc sp. 106C]|uniref:DUF6887 family protein n=1 Tax=Nostoc sp. 106C TaxID=1932667 RepID=UPI000A3A75F8|nr:hypothetical protein [Nostoc sp. 106C]OUL34698.1 hypothetical protein BV375_03670 [Nostoc sp. 106C]
MTTANYDAMGLDELRRYVLTHREDIIAFQVYVDRSQAAGRMISIDMSDIQWEENLSDRIQRLSVEGESD